MNYEEKGGEMTLYGKLQIIYENFLSVVTNSCLAVALQVYGRGVGYRKCDL